METPESGPKPATPDPAPPPAAKIVLDTPADEEDAAEIVQLRRERDEAGRKLKDRESRVNELEDENRRLKSPPAPAPAVKKKDWLEGNTFFG